MKIDVEIICDRCGKTVNGVIIEADSQFPELTGGFYKVGEGTAWREFSISEDEQYVCDFCMWADPIFLERYPNNRKFPDANPPNVCRFRDKNEVDKIKAERLEKMAASIARQERKEAEKDKDKPDKPDKPNKKK